MKTHFDIEQLIEKGVISNELDYERALIADKKLRLLSKENDYFKKLRNKLRNIIEIYEATCWSDVEAVTAEQISENEQAEKIANSESSFIEHRKKAIKIRLKELDLTQENLAFLLGHKSKTHMSELMNGIKPFTLKDLILINRILEIELSVLVPNFLSVYDHQRLKDSVQILNKPNLKFSSNGFVKLNNSKLK
jgi:transcriptional regulator with XRE-family HTH domain